MRSDDSPSMFDRTDVPDFSIEGKWAKAGKRIIAGVDEVGRGPLAGPVVAAAVVLDPERLPEGLNDSKKLTEAKREHLYGEILESSHTAWCSLPAAVVDELNIRQATLNAMQVAVSRLEVCADFVLVDGRDVPPGLAAIGSAYVKGDSRSLSIAAASIVAKVIRDRMMKRAHVTYPQYGFGGHKGYASQAHRTAIQNYGPCPLHRKSFAPIKHMI